MVYFNNRLFAINKCPKMPAIFQAKDYDLWLHFKQGDQMAEFLKDSEGNIPDALRLYAEFMRDRAEYLDELAEDVERELSNGAGIEMQADTNFIGFSGDEDALDRLAERKLLNCHEYED